MFTHYYNAFEDEGKPFGWLLRGTSSTEFAVMSFVCFLRTTESGASDLFLPSRCRALKNEGHFSVDEGVLKSLSHKMRENILERGLLRSISDCEAVPMTTLLIFARANEKD